MKAVLLAAGKGKRMQPLTLTTPKPLLKVLGKPILEYTFEALPDEIDEVYVIVGYLQEQIREHFGKEWHGRNIHYVEQIENMGTGDAVMRVREYCRRDEKFLVLNGDDLYHKADLEEMIQHNWVLLASQVENPSRFGVLQVDREGFLVDIIEKPRIPSGDLINAGAYVIDANYFDAPLVSIKGDEYGLPQTLQKMVHDGLIHLRVQIATFWFPLGYPVDILEAEKALRERQQKQSNN